MDLKNFTNSVTEAFFRGTVLVILKNTKALS